MNVIEISFYTFKSCAAFKDVTLSSIFCCFNVHPAEAAAVRVPESAGFGPGGGPGSQGGAYTGDFTHYMAFPFNCHDVHIQVFVTR